MGRNSEVESKTLDSFKLSAQTDNNDPYSNRFTGNFNIRDTNVVQEIQIKGGKTKKGIRSNSQGQDREERASCFLKIFGCGR